MAMNRTKHFKAMGSLALAAICGMLSAGAMARSQQLSAQQSSEDVAETYQARCSTCHAEHGEGSEVGASLNVPDLRSQRVQKNDDAFLRQFVKNGRGNMPAFGRDFSEEQLSRLIALVRSFAADPRQQAKSQSSSR
jgi:mono/diheme cytochrome c family protein